MPKPWTPLILILAIALAWSGAWAVNLHVGSWLAPAHAAMNWGRDRALLGGGKNGGGGGACSNKLDLTQTCNDVLFFTIGR